MRLGNKILVLVLVAFSTIIGAGKSVAQDSVKTKAFTDGTSLSFQSHYGFILVHRDNMSHLVRGHVPAFELTLEKQTSGLSDWHSAFYYPSLGVSIWYSDLGNKEQLGSGSAVFGFVNFPIIRTARFLLKYRFGSGVGVVSKPFDRESNYKNTAIGSKLNMFGLQQLNMKIMVTEKLGITAAVELAHFSNGSFKVPNLGINIPAVSIGATYDIGDYRLSEFEKAKKEHDKGLDLNIQVGFAAREIHPVGQSKYAVFHGMVEGTRRVSRRRKIGIGLDGFFDASTMVLYNRDTNNVASNNQVEFIRYGVHLSHELVLGRFSAITQMGVYLYTKYKNDGSFYHRFSYRYLITKHVYADITIKTHWAVAQYVSFGFGYKF